MAYVSDLFLCYSYFKGKHTSIIYVNTVDRALKMKPNPTKNFQQDRYKTVSFLRTTIASLPTKQTNNF